MKLIECSRCGSKELHNVDGTFVCNYCQSRFKSELNVNTTIIDVNSDIQLLLKKCIEDPLNRRRYANLILDIDPSNLEVMKYLT
jgi:transcription elongation factor Elf1